MFSSAIELIHSPPDLMTSLERSTISAQPSGSIVQTSPVRNQPSASAAPSAPRFRYSRAHPVAAHQEVAERLAVPRQFSPFRVDDLHIGAAGGAALSQPLAHRVLAGQGGARGGRRIIGDDRGRLGHAPALLHVDAHRRIGLDDKPRQRGAGDQQALELRQPRSAALEVGEQPEPDRRNARGQRDALGFEHFVQAGAVEMPARQDQSRADHRRTIRQAPRAGVVHRRRREHPIHCAEPENIRRIGGVGVQHRRAMAVEHSLRSPGRAGGVAERARSVLVELGPDVILVRLGHQRLVAVEAHAGRER